MKVDLRELLRLAAEEGFANCALVRTEEIPFEPGFLVCCEENLCGKYGVNWACPPTCGTPAQMAAKVRAHTHGLLLQTMWQIDDPEDKVQIKQAKATHNRMERRLKARLEALGLGSGFLIGASGCDFCAECSLPEACRFPEQQTSCMSAYCIFVRQLAEGCGMEYELAPGLVAFFGMYIFSV